MPKIPDTSNDSLLRDYVKARQAEVRVESYDEKVVNRAFKLRTGGYWAGTAMGLTWGVIVGAITIAALPVLFDVALTTALAVKTVAAIAAIGAVSGTTAGQIIGAAAGAASGAAMERERRDKAEALEKEILKNPPTPEQMRETVAAHQEEMAKRDAEGKSEFHTVQDVYRQTGGSVSKTAARLVQPKVLLTSMALGSVIGVAMALGGASVAGSAIGKELSGWALAGLGAFVGAAAGGSFGFNFPAIFTSLRKISSSILSGQAFQGAEPALAPPQPVKSVEKAVEPAVEESPRKNFTASVKSTTRVYVPAQSASYQELLHYQEQQTQLQGITRP